MKERVKRRLTYFAVIVFFLLEGVEYAIILPTVYQYLQSLGGEAYQLGLVISAFHVSGLVAAPIFGKFSDKRISTKWLVIFSNCFEKVGNLIYFIGGDKWLLFAGRLVAGVGSGAAATMFAFLARVTEDKDRTAIFSLAMGARQIGLLIGPGLYLGLRLVNLKLGAVEINELNSPGLFMTLMWIIMDLLMVFLFWDFANKTDDGVKEIAFARHFCCGVLKSNKSPSEELAFHFEDGLQTEIYPVTFLSGRRLSMNTVSTRGNRQSIMHRVADIAHIPTITETFNEMRENDKNNAPYDTTNVNNVAESEETERANGTSNNFLSISNFKRFRHYFKKTVITVLLAQFVTLFNQTSLETLVTPYTEEHFQFHTFENSLLYLVGGVEVIVGFVIVRLLSKKLQDRSILLIGTLICVTSCVWFAIFLVQPMHPYTWLLVEFAVAVFLQLLGLPFVAAAQASLFSKVTPEKDQGLSQGIRHIVGGVAAILGPIVAGAFTGQLYGLLATMIVFLVVLLVLMGVSFKSLNTNTCSISGNAEHNEPSIRVTD
ncbi:major facilitator superfamily domain-containing protein 8 [Lingula anatina]|uniref:Major facilitator superfamily domain-containing protein 8 n=1 Tax=Lingula anatina TaxID=7574 RepID=A0A1S3J8S6_LINAN|nr:major facilitator superfamily domain-containing protein 8 [Lingula anatina]XP_013406812.1 major facilitator superfamily domain-containing protein 8 [Lingula anatina]XP_013406823.1 major facilitator superfamily domain-containing protein 8 [Lingula anatina]|eukprot:XP_013406803.1 major facilitator superfamily domain-containing protein 8 [Lingula anatina]